ncbi:NlpC/P60 family protein [Ruixingdingia sedimenti]|uniref:NlpC/P60 family protein n=1 Tax=Ruixingdingia sedimenti TaxID=3073604 RepID=A0ABU1F8S2_9RHOB|nr:NlpC/P60 family protein [Xinfangfangia sp. LG-4]MDR5653280.1 NlpC/P60 family protein [Xinfangfangia sp. LG-4]
MDRRLTPANGRVAHVSLRGRVEAPAYVAGEWARVVAPLADLNRAPGRARDRQVLMGDRFLVLDRDGGHAFGQAEKDGYVGWLAEAALGPDTMVTHWICAPGSHLYPEPRVQAHEVAGLSLGARLAVTGAQGAFAAVPQGWVPACHLRAIGDWADDPVAVAESLTGTPYLWGGNSRAGVDCSGLVQLAFHACGRACPGDSDMQAGMGAEIGPDDLRRGDLVFWKGHVALVAGPDRIVHANGHHMAVAAEPLSDAVARIAAAGGGGITARRRAG